MEVTYPKFPSPEQAPDDRRARLTSCAAAAMGILLALLTVALLIFASVDGANIGAGLVSLLSFAFIAFAVICMPSYTSIRAKVAAATTLGLSLLLYFVYPVAGNNFVLYAGFGVQLLSGVIVVRQFLRRNRPDR